MITIRFKSNLPPLDPIMQSASLRDGRDAAGEAVVTRLQDHWFEQDARPNKRNWPKRNFWASVAAAVNSVKRADAYQVVVPLAAFWRRYLGGDAIVPKQKKRLAIPAIAEAYAAGRPGAGRIPVELSVFVLKKRAGREPTLALAEFSERPGKRDPEAKVKVRGRIWYWLVQQANPAADPNAMPPPGALDRTATDTLNAYMAALTARLNKGGTPA